MDISAIAQSSRIQKLGSAAGTRFLELSWTEVWKEVGNAPAFNHSFIHSFHMHTYRMPGHVTSQLSYIVNRYNEESHLPSL